MATEKNTMKPGDQWYQDTVKQYAQFDPYVMANPQFQISMQTQRAKMNKKYDADLAAAAAQKESVVNTEESGPDVSGNESMDLGSLMAEYLKYNPQVAEQSWGLTSQYLPQYAALMRGEISKDRTSDIGDVSRLLPNVRAIDEANQTPQVRDIRSLLSNQILGELQAGGKMTPGQEALSNEYLRSGEISRGVSAGQGSANRESVKKAIESLDLATQRQGKASNLLGLEKSLTTDPYAAILGRNPVATNAATGLTSQGNTLLNPGTVFQAAGQKNSGDLAWAQFNQQADWRNQMLKLMQANPEYDPIAGF